MPQKEPWNAKIQQVLLEIPHHLWKHISFIHLPPPTKKYLTEFSLFTMFKLFQPGLDPRNPETPPAIVAMLQEVEDNVHRWIPDVTYPVVPIHLQTWWSTGRFGAHHREVLYWKIYVYIYICV